jgi:hypothetical protein
MPKAVQKKSKAGTVATITLKQMAAELAEKIAFRPSKELREAI